MISIIRTKIFNKQNGTLHNSIVKKRHCSKFEFLKFFKMHSQIRKRVHLSAYSFIHCLFLIERIVRHRIAIGLSEASSHRFEIGIIIHGTISERIATKCTAEHRIVATATTTPKIVLTIHNNKKQENQ